MSERCSDDYPEPVTTPDEAALERWLDEHPEQDAPDAHELRRWADNEGGRYDPINRDDDVLEPEPEETL